MRNSLLHRYSLLFYLLMLLIVNAEAQTIKTNFFDATYFDQRFISNKKHLKYNQSGWGVTFHKHFRKNISKGRIQIYSDSSYQILAITGKFKKGKKHGIWTEYYTNRKPWRKIKYRNGKRDGYMTHYKTNGDILWTQKIKNGKAEGKVCSKKKYYSFDFYQKYSLKGTSYYTNGKREGRAHYVSQDQSLHRYPAYKNGQLHGSYYTVTKFKDTLKVDYYTDHKLDSTINYENQSFETTYNLYIDFVRAPQHVDSLLENLQHFKNLTTISFIGTEDSNQDSVIAYHAYKLLDKKKLIKVRYTGFNTCPPEIFECKHIETLWLRGKFVNELPEAITKMKRLKRLDFCPQHPVQSQNQIIETIAQIKSLKELKISCLEPGEFYPTNLDQLKRIKALFIPYSDTTVGIPEEVLELKKLEFLKLNAYMHLYLGHKKYTKLPNTIFSDYEVCFIPGTAVTMADGNKKAIELLKPGDLVLGMDTTTQTLDTATVMQLHMHKVEKRALVKLSFKNTATMLTCTPNHPIWTGLAWVAAEMLKTGDTVYLYNETAFQLEPKVINMIEHQHAQTTVYNISTTLKNYLANGVLVHNK